MVGLCFVASVTGAFAQEVLLGTQGSSSNPGVLFQIDPTTGFVTGIGNLVSSTGQPYAITGMGFDNLTGILYGSTSNLSPTNPGNLVTINPNTGQVTLVGPFGVGPNNTMADLTFDTTTGKMFGTWSATGDLYSINLGTGAATLIGSSGIAVPFGLGLAADSAGVLFGTPNGGSGSLVTYNKTNGSVTTVAPLSGSFFSGTSSINALAFNAAGSLFGINASGSSARLIQINDVTGAITDIGPTASRMDAIVFYNPTAVPEPTTTALLGAGLIFLTRAGFRRYRTRTSAS